MNTPDHPSPRQRLKALLAIPDSQRSEAQWDEIVELEITLAPGNRDDIPHPAPREKGPAGPATAGSGNKPAGAPSAGRRSSRRFKKKPKVEPV